MSNRSSNDFHQSPLDFNSVYNETGDDPEEILNEKTLADLRPTSLKEHTLDEELEMEEKTIYISEADENPPELDTLNKTLEGDWYIKDISLGRRKSTQEYCFVVTLEREAPQSFFDIVTSASDSSSPPALT